VQHFGAALRAQRDDGFSLVEVLVVTVIIGILAAIALPLLFSQRKKGYDASIKSDLRTVANDMESYYTEFEAYPTTLDGATVTGSAPIGNEVVRLSAGNSVQIDFNAPKNAYCLQGTNTQATSSTGWFYISNQGGIQPSGTTSCGSY